jgi:PAS domain S-box-containing protein
MTVHLEPPFAAGDTLSALREHNAELERRLAACDAARQSLQEQVDIIAQTMDLLDEMVLIKGPKSRIVYANKAFRDLYGMSLEQLNGLIDAPFNEPDYTQQYIRDDEQVFATGQPLDIPAEHVTRHDGALRLVHTLKAPIRNAAGQVTHTAGVIRDITEDTQAQAELQIYAEVVGSMQHGVCVWQLKQLDDPSSLTAVTANPAATRITGVDLQQQRGKRFNEIFPDTPQEDLLAVYAQVIHTGQARNLGEVTFDGPAAITFTIQAFPLPNHCIAISF